MMNVRSYLKVLRLYWMFISVVTIVGVAAGAGLSLLATPKYSATAQVFVSAGQSSSVTDLSVGTSFTQQAVKSYATVAQSRLVLRRVAAQLDLHESLAQLAENISTDVPLDTSVLQITARDRSPAVAASVANSVAANLSSAVAELAPPSAAGAVKITEIDDATPSRMPVSPNYLLNAIIGLLAGALIGFLVALVRDRADTRIHSDKEMEEVSGLPTLGTVPFDDSLRIQPLSDGGGRSSSIGEGYRALRTNLQFLNADSRLTSLVVTSAVPGEGKTTTAANLSIAIAALSTSVVVVGADLRRPSLAEYLGVDGTVGLTDVLIGRVSLDDALQPWGPNASLQVLPAGPLPPNPSELLQSSRMTALVEELRSRFDMVVFDAPPVLPVADALILGKQTQGALLVYGVGRARRHEVQRTVAALRQVEVRTLGTVASMVPIRQLRAYGYGSYAPYGPAGREAGPVTE